MYDLLGHKTGFPFQNNLKNLDPFYKMALDVLAEKISFLWLSELSKTDLHISVKLRSPTPTHSCINTVQSNFNGSNSFGTMKRCSRQG